MSKFNSDLEVVWIFLSILLIVLILYRVPRSPGLQSFTLQTPKSEIVRSPNLRDKLSNYVILVLVIVYFSIAIALNQKI